MHSDSVRVAADICVLIMCVCCDLTLCSGVLLNNERYTGPILSVLNGSIRLM
jgi:hypothetical protein